MQIQFVFDHRSIYSYLANSQVVNLKATVDYRPVDIVAVMKEVHNQPSPMCPPKARYSLMDAKRWASLYDLPLNPNDELLGALRQGRLPDALLSRAALAARQLGIFEKVNDALFRAVWAGSDDLATDEGRIRFADSHALPVSLWEIAESGSVFEELAANNQWAIANGVFGAPTFFVGKEMFFGNDRLSFVRDRLATTAQGVEP